MSKPEITIEQLIAFSDGRLDHSESEAIRLALQHNPELHEQLADIAAINHETIKQAYTLNLQQAPIESLEARLDRAAAVVTVADVKTQRFPLARWRGIAAIVALTSLFAIIGYTAAVNRFGVTTTASADKWRESVAVYQTLYTKQTLDHISMTEKQRDVMLERVRRLSGIDIKLLDLTQQGLKFKRAQLLTFNGAPLVQLAYLTTKGKPVAICFLKDKRIDHRVRQESRHGLRIAFWTNQKQPVMIVGDIEPEKLLAVSKRVRLLMR